MRIAILTPPGVQMLDVAGPIDVFYEANNHVPSHEKYEVSIIGRTREAVLTSSGSRVLPDASIADQLVAFDTVLVAGSPSIRDHEQDVGLLNWLGAQASMVRRLGSICTGAFLLGHAGLLNGRRATTHWGAIDRLSTTFPAIQVEAGSLYVKDGSVYTSAGVGAAIHLALALVEADHGRGVASRVAEEMTLFPNEAGRQSLPGTVQAVPVSCGGRMGEIQDWIQSHLPDDLSVETLASRLGMSARNFARLFKRETDMTPGDYVQVARVHAARKILEETNSPLKRVASSCGFSDQGTLRRAFARCFHVTPNEYRKRLHSKEPAVTVTHLAA